MQFEMHCGIYLFNVKQACLKVTDLFVSTQSVLCIFMIHFTQFQTVKFLALPPDTQPIDGALRQL